jgi:hypothetical protein
MAGTTENILYVIFHGLVSLVDIGAAGFNAYMFDMGTDHRYLFGTWLIEDDIPEPSNDTNLGPLILTLDSVIAGVLDPPNNVLDPDLNLVIQLDAPLPLNLSGARAVVRLPRPRRIYYYTCGDVPSSTTIQGDLSKLIVKNVPPSIISETRVFEYTFGGSQKPQLLAGDPPAGDPLWSPDVLATVGNRNVATLHFYDEPGEPFDDDSVAQQHARAEFLLSTAILGVPLRLTQPSSVDHLEPPVPPHKPQPTRQTLGILKREVTPLDERNEALLDLQYFKRSDPPKERKPPATTTTGGGGGPICGGGNAQVVQLSDRSKSGEAQNS